MATPAITAPHFAGARDVGDGAAMTLVLIVKFNGAQFQIVAADPDDEAVGHALVPGDYRFAESIESKFLIKLAELSWGQFDLARAQESGRLERQLADLAIEACLPTMQRLAPTPIQGVQTLQDHLHPEIHTLQVLTQGGKLACHSLNNSVIPPEESRSVSAEKLRAMGLDIETTDIPVVQASQVMLGRCLKGYVWRVTVDGEDLVYKSLINVTRRHIGDELATYLRFRSAGVQWKVPELKGGFSFPLPSPNPEVSGLPNNIYVSPSGIVQDNEQVIGILLAYIPHKHHNLRFLLDGIERGTIAPEEATGSLRQKWATQIRDTVAGLHAMGILWLDVKTDNVLIDEDGDAVVIDFGGGNTVGWIDHDKYGTMEGEMQGLNKIMAALGIEASSD